MNRIYINGVVVTPQKYQEVLADDSIIMIPEGNLRFRTIQKSQVTNHEGLQHLLKTAGISIEPKPQEITIPKKPVSAPKATGTAKVAVVEDTAGSSDVVGN